MAALTFLALLTALTTASPTALTQRDDFCGTDYYGYDWYCTTTAACCSGSLQSTCIPLGYTCCTTGYFCSPDEECVLDTSTLTQYCVAADRDGAQATRSAESEGAKETDDGGGGGNEKSDDDENDAATMMGVSLASLLSVVGVAISMILH